MDAPAPARWTDLLAGATAATAGLAAGVLADSVVGPVPSLVDTVGQAFIRLSPGGFSRAAIDAVGTGDKPLLRATTVLATLLLGALAGRLAVRGPRWGDAVLVGLGVVPVLAALRLPRASVPGTIAGAVLATVVACAVLRTLRPPSRVVAPQPPVPGQGVDRRRFLTAVTGTVGASVVGVTLARAGSLATRDPRAGIRLPPASDGAPVPAAATDAAGFPAGTSPLIVPTGDFYRIDEALIPPSVDPGSWELRFTGMVDRPFTLTYDQLLAEPLIERVITMSCVSNEIGGDLVGNARWRGVRLDALLERAGVQEGATQIVGRSVDGFTVGFPTEVAMDGRDAMVAVGMNGEPLPVPHGFPARLVVPGLYGFVSATKWLTEIELTTWEGFDSYWTERGWSKTGPVKVQSRIDVPRDRSTVAAGRVRFGGVAWAPSHGIAAVELRVDDGDWFEADLGERLGTDSWRQWKAEADLTAGQHKVQVRATTDDGETQTTTRTPPFPDGASGHHTLRLRVED